MSSIEFNKFSRPANGATSSAFTPLDEVAGSIIRTLRENSNTSLETISKATGVPIQSIQCLERGIGRVLDMCIISNYFKIAAIDFFNMVDEAFNALHKK